MSWLSKALGISSSQNPARAAMPYLNQVPGVVHQGYDPYVQQGQQAGQTLQSEYSKQLDPATFLSHLQEGYKPSSEYDFKKEELMKGMRAMGGAGGYSGTPLHQMQYGEQADKLLSGDMQQYLQNALGIYGQGIAGTQDFYNKGYGATSSLTDALGSNLQTQATNAFTGQQQQNQSRQALMNALMKALTQGASAGVGYMGGGWKGAGNMLSGGMSNGY